MTAMSSAVKITTANQAGRVMYGLRVRTEKIIRQHEAMVTDAQFFGLKGIRQEAYELHRWALVLERFMNAGGEIDFSGVDPDERLRLGL